MREYLDKFNYDGNDLGVKFLKDSISLKIWAPTAYKVQVAVYRDCFQKQDKPNFVYDMLLDEYTGVHSIRVEKLKIDINIIYINYTLKI